jgi:hypothetical protein
MSSPLLSYFGISNKEMDMMELAAGYASIMGLVSAYRAEGRALTDDAFKEWLVDHHHQTIIEFIDENKAINIYMKALLNEQSETMDKIHEKIIDLVSQFENFQSMFNVINTDTTLSTQAVNILKDFNRGGSHRLIANRLYDGGEKKYDLVTLGKGGNIEYTNFKTIISDLESLLASNYLIEVKNNSKGCRSFEITNNGVNFSEQPSPLAMKVIEFMCELKLDVGHV